MEPLPVHHALRIACLPSPLSARSICPCSFFLLPFTVGRFLAFNFNPGSPRFPLMPYLWASLSSLTCLCVAEGKMLKWARTCIMVEKGFKTLMWRCSVMTGDFQWCDIGRGGTQ